MSQLKRSFFSVRIRLTVFIAALLIPYLALAKHIIGGEMTYRFVADLGGNVKRYEFTLVIYRDCDSGGGNLDANANIAIYEGDLNGAMFVAKFTAPLQGPTKVDPVIPPCADASAVTNACVERGIYVFTRDLTVLTNMSDFIVYQRCCRTDQILNIVTPGSFGATYMVEINPLAQASNNSSPTFLNYPPTFICDHFPVNFNHSATDIDGDSLVYSFCAPLNGGGSGGGGNGCNSAQPNPPCGPPFTSLSYTAGYNALVPMGGSPIIKIDSVTGILSGTPMIIGQFVVGICVKEYRNGQLIGSILRDFQFNVVDCTPTVVANVKADDVTGPKQFHIKRCGEKVVTILNKSPLTPDLTTWQWEVDFGNGAIFNSNAWNLTVALPDFGIYTARLYLNRGLNCQDTAFVNLEAFPGVKADFDFTWDVCTETPVAFSDSSVSGAAGGIVSTSWILGVPSDTLHVLNPDYQFPAYGTYPVKLAVVDSDGCKDEIVKTVDWHPHLPPVIPNPGFLKVCMPDAVEFHPLDTFDLTGAQLVWDFGDSSFANIASPTHQYAKPGVYTASIAIKTAYDCYATDTFVNQILVRPSPTADFDYSPKTVSNLQNTVHFQNQSDSSAVIWNWNFGSHYDSHQRNPVVSFAEPQDTGVTPVRLLVTNEYGCADSVTRFLDVVPLAQLYIPNVFKPLSDNGNGNDRFSMLGILPSYSDYSMTIWSRWGEKLFESKNPADYWDGRRQGNNRTQPPGVYIYIISFKGPRGEPFHYEGTVTIL